MFAFYWNNKTVVICDNNAGRGGVTVKVAGKREARVIAAKHGAVCWNF